jgi:hypothetical protein
VSHDRCFAPAARAVAIAIRPGAIVADNSDDARFITRAGVFHGKNVVRTAFTNLFADGRREVRRRDGSRSRSARRPLGPCAGGPFTAWT